MAHNTRPLKRAQDGIAPQYYNELTDEYEVLQGTAGANHVVIYGPDGQPAALATEAKLEAVRALLALLEGKDFATDMKAEAIRLLLASLDGKDFASETTLTAIRDSDGIKRIADAVTVSGLENLATETRLEAVRALLALLEGKDFATDTKAEAIRLLLASLDGKDFASETTLAAMETELGLAKTELAAIKGMLTDGTAKGEVTLSGAIVELPKDPSYPTTITAGATVLMFGSTTAGVRDFKAIRIGIVSFSLGCNLDVVVTFYPAGRYGTYYHVGSVTKKLSGSSQVSMNELIELTSPYFDVKVKNLDVVDTPLAGTLLVGVR